MAIEFSHYVKVSGWLGEGKPAILVELQAAKGSTPREAGAAMSVCADAISGTIGGGQLEWIAIRHAREMLASGEAASALDIPLGPEIGQCCGGRVKLRFRNIDAQIAQEMEGDAKKDIGSRRKVLVFGAGHTGTALALAMARLPYDVVLIDSRAEAVAAVPPEITTRLSALPEAEIRTAEPGSAFVAMTHEHSLDFLVTAQALARGDAAYCGMIGSATKRAVFMNWLAENGYRADLAGKLTCPIGSATIRDKRPEIIAALTAAEIIAALQDQTSDSTT